MPHSGRSEPRPEQSLVASFPLAETLTRQYRVLRPIGQGGYGQVVLAEHRRTGTKVAIKSVSRRSMPRVPTSEWELMKELRHPNVMKLLQVLATEDTTYLVTQYAGGGDLWELLGDVGPMAEDVARRLFRQVVRGVHHCHQHGVAHRDLKPENLLLHQGNVWVSDFGLGARFVPGQTLAGVLGTLPFMAPEVLSGKDYHGPAADAWSLGVLLVNMVTGEEPFDGPFVLVGRKVRRCRYTCPRHLSRPLRDLIRQLLRFSPRRRPTMEQVLAHPWLLRDRHQDPEPAPEPLRDPKRDAILRVMSMMRHDPQDVLESLQHHKYDERMATYLILQDFAREGLGFPIRVRSASPEVAPSGPSTPPTPSVLCPVRTPSALADCPVARQPREDMELGQEGGRTAFHPAPRLSCQNGETQAPRAAFPGGPEAAPSHPGVTTTTARDKKRGWKGLRRRVTNCFRALCCCCLPAGRHQAAGM
ncbi:sperm motility kinase Z-like [Ctenodactylus gundi]